MSKVFMVDGKLVAARFPLIKPSTSAPDKYQMAALLSIEGLDDGEWHRVSADQQRAVFGAYLFGKKEIRANTNDQGSVEVRWLGAWEGTHSSYVEHTVTFDQIVRAASGDKSGWPL